MTPSDVSMDNSTVERKKFVTALSRVKGACLKEQQFVPILSQLCFNKGLLFAFDDTVACILRLDFPQVLDGRAIPVSIFETLSNSTAKVVSITEKEDDSICIKFGRATLITSCLDKGSFIFTPDNVLKSKPFVSIEMQAGELKGALECCIPGIGTLLSIVNEIGVTVVDSGVGCNLYSTDNISVSKYSVKARVLRKARTRGARVGKNVAIISKKSCLEILSQLKLLSEEVTVVLAIIKEGIIVREKESEDWAIFSKVVGDASESLDFEELTFSRVSETRIEQSSKFFKSISNSIDRLSPNLAALSDKFLVIKATRAGVFIESLGTGSSQFKEKVALGSIVKQEFEFMSELSVFARACKISSSLGFNEFGNGGVLAVFKGSAGKFSHILSSVKPGS